MIAPPRSRQRRKRDTLRRLEQDVDAWTATADEAGGAPYLVPLSFLWDGSTLLVATPAGSPTGRNLAATGKIRLGIGPTRDVVIIEGTARPVATGELPADVGDAFAAKTGFDPRQLTTEFRYFRVHPQRLQAWREANELAERDLMRDGQWLVHDGQEPDAAAGSSEETYDLRPVGWVVSPLTDQESAPKQGDEGAPPARIILRPELREAAADLGVGTAAVVLTWLHEGRRDVLSVHPRDDLTRPRLGVFSTRSPDRPNPIGLHTITVTGIEENAITVEGLEAIDGTPVLDLKPVLGTRAER